jgi:hypothetical protein
MTAYRVSFFNELTNSRGTLYKVCQRSVEIRTARSLDRAVEAAKKRFARLENVGEWRLHARLFEVEPLPDDKDDVVAPVVGSVAAHRAGRARRAARKSG